MALPTTPVKTQHATGSGHQLISTLVRYGLSKPSLLSWVLWLVSVGIFMMLLNNSHHPATQPEWVGFIIRTSVYALWALVMREWFAIRLEQ